MGDNLRGVIFGDWIRKQFPPRRFPRVADIAGGTGILSGQLKLYGYDCTVFDLKGGKDKGYKRIKKNVEELTFDVGDYDLVIGLHPDQASYHIIRLAKESHSPFAIVPCCVMPPTKYKHLKFTEEEWVNWLTQQARLLGFETYTTELRIQGKNRVLKGWKK